MMEGQRDVNGTLLWYDRFTPGKEDEFPKLKPVSKQDYYDWLKMRYEENDKFQKELELTKEEKAVKLKIVKGKRKKQQRIKRFWAEKEKNKDFRDMMVIVKGFFEVRNEPATNIYVTEKR